MFTELIFNYGSRFEVVGQHIENYSDTGGHQILSGLKTKPFWTTVAGIYESVGLILKPFCYGLLIERLGTRAMNQVSEMLYDQFFYRDHPIPAVVEQQLLELFDPSKMDSDFLKFEHFVATGSLEKGALKEFNSSISISQKSFIRKFKNQYMLSPNEYVKLKKVNTAVALLQDDRSDKLTAIGLEAGFYDQSHFIRVFKNFCGCTPKEFGKCP